MRRNLQVLAILGVCAVAGAFSLAQATGSAEAFIHEIVAAYCSGGGVGAIEPGGDLEPPGVSDPTKSSFAKPVLASGAVVVPALVIGDRPNAKYPAGTSVFALGDPDHPSAEHCRALNP